MILKGYKKLLWIISIIIFFIILIIKFIQLSKIIYLYPSYDFSSHIANLFFLKEYGFHNISPNWFNGFRVLEDYPPLFFFFAYAIYKLISNNIQLAFYISLIGIIIIGFLGVYLLGRALNISKIKTLFLFLFFYSNPVTIPWFYTIGRIPEMFGWTLLFYLLSLIFYFKDKELDYRFYIYLIAILTLILLAHPLIFTLSLFVVFGLFLIKNNKERLKIIISMLFIPLLSSFWLIGFISNINTLKNYAPSYRIYQHPTEFLYSIIFPLALFLVFWLYKKIKNLKKKEITFYYPLLVVPLLYLTNLFLYIPILKSIEPRTYGIFSILISTILILTFNPKNTKADTLISIGVIAVAIISAVIFFTHYSYIDFPLYNQANTEIRSLLPNITEKFIVIDENGDINKKHIYAFAAVKYNLTTPWGWGMGWISENSTKIRKEIKDSIPERDCKKFLKVINENYVKEIISNKKNCDFLINCKINKKEESYNYCLLGINS